MVMMLMKSSNNSKACKSQRRLPTRCLSPLRAVQCKRRRRMLRMRMKCKQSFRFNLLRTTAKRLNQMCLAKFKRPFKAQKKRKKRLIAPRSKICPKLHLVRRNSSRHSTKMAAPQINRWPSMSLVDPQVDLTHPNSPPATSIFQI